MGLKAMVSRDGDQAPHFFPPLLNQAGSIYNFMYNEAQSHLSDHSKPLNAMNLYEPVDTMNTFAQQIQAPTSSSSSSTTSIAPPLPTNCNTFGHKTAGEAWQEMQQEEQHSNGKCATLGETTLEDFLHRAVVTCLGSEEETKPLLAVDPMVQQPTEWFQYGSVTAQQQQHQNMTLLCSNLPMFGNAIGVSENQQMGMPVVSAAMVRPATLDSQTLMEINRHEETTNKSIERKQKRMIKNRESAARSRAKKQAYIKELEEKEAQLKEANERLKKQKELEMLLRSYSVLQPTCQLRRTRSAKF